MNHVKKPDWLKINIGANARYTETKHIVDSHKLHTICSSGRCPNMGECWGKGTATFMIGGEICTRSCKFCNTQTGRPLPLDPEEPTHVAESIQLMKLSHAVITSVDRDDLPDRGAGHFAECVKEVRALNPGIKIEILVPDFRGRITQALKKLKDNPPDVFNHNLENVPRLYKEIRPGADYQWSLKLLHDFKEMFPNIPTKSGLMVGLGETNEEILQVMEDLRANGVTMLTLGQYLQPSRHHLPVARYVPPAEFDEFRDKANAMGFEHAACGPFVRSSYHADLQASGGLVK